MTSTLIFFHLTFVVGFEAFGASQGWSWTEPFIAILSFAHLAFYIHRPPTLGEITPSRMTLVSCLILATAGELTFSTLCGLYGYRVSILPLFVPPCHVLLFLLGLDLSQRIRISVAAAIPAATVLVLAYQWSQGRDMLSLLLVMALIPCLLYGKDRRLYLVMFALAMALEFYGTAIGTWTWKPHIPGTRLFSANPPLAAGVFYALLDLLTLWVTDWIQKIAATERPKPVFSLPKTS